MILQTKIIQHKFPLTGERVIDAAAFAVSDQKCAMIVALLQQSFLGLSTLQLAKIPTVQKRTNCSRKIHMYLAQRCALPMVLTL